MGIEVELVDVAACPTAVIEGHATPADLPTTIGRLIDRVWEFLRTSGLVTNHNVVVYRSPIAGEGGAIVEVGVQVDRRFADAPDGVVASELPAARVARAMHRGPYHRIAETHDAVAQWCLDNGHRRTGSSWEIYGDWTDDVDALETEVMHEIERR